MTKNKTVKQVLEDINRRRNARDKFKRKEGCTTEETGDFMSIKPLEMMPEDKYIKKKQRCLVWYIAPYQKQQSPHTLWRKRFLCLISYAPHHKGITGSGGTAAHINLGTRWRLVVSFTPQLLYSREKSLWYPLERNVGEPQSQSALWIRGKTSCLSHKSYTNSLTIQSVAQPSYTSSMLKCCST